MPESPEPTALYRLYDASDTLLYIGISNDPDFRWRAHLYERRRDDWPKRAARRTVEWFPSRDEALRAEADTIRAEHPQFNVAHAYDEAPFDPAAWPSTGRASDAASIAEMMRQEIASGRWKAGQRIPSQHSLAAAAGASTSSAGKAIALLKTEGLLRLEAGCGLFVTSTTPQSGQDVPPTPAISPPKPRTLTQLPHDFFTRLGWPG